MFGRKVEEFSNNAAIKCSNTIYSYQELAVKSCILEKKLREMNIGRGSRIAVWTSESIYFVTCLLTVIKIGGIFIPISYDSPKERIEIILKDCQPEALMLGDGNQEIEEFQILDIIETQENSNCSIYNESQLIYGENVEEKDFCYIAYTSGTTGEPKGVTITYEGIINFCEAIQSDYHLDHNSRLLPLFPLYFDGSLGSIFATLYYGGTLVFSKGNCRVGRILRKLLTEEKITHIGCTPTVLTIMLKEIEKIKKDGGNVYLKSVGLGGEACRINDLKKMMELLPDTSVYNRYGPTETTVTALSCLITRSDIELGKIPIGKPLKNVSAKVVDESYNVVANNTKGELCLGGVQVMAGYWNEQELTNAVIKNIDGQLMYCTNDYVIKDENGTYFFMGRKGDMIKRNGMRIHLNEVDEALKSIKIVKDAMCISVVDDDIDISIIVAFVIMSKRVEITYLRWELAKKIPVYMMPDDYIEVKEFPLSDIGKADTKKLKKIYLEKMEGNLNER